MSANERKAIQTTCAVAVKTDATKTVEIKCNNNLSSFNLQFIINFVLTEPKLVHGPVKFPPHSISHFVMNIITAGSTAKVNSVNIFSNSLRPYGIQLFLTHIPVVRLVLA